MRVLALDPGEKVGWARADISSLLAFDDLEHGITPLKDMAMAVRAKISEYDIIVMETWRLFPQAAKSMIGSDMQSSQFIGMVRYEVWNNPHCKLVMQGPGVQKTARKTAPKWLQEIIDNEPKAHDDGHNVSALLHLWHWGWNEYVYKEAQ